MATTEQLQAALEGRYEIERLIGEGGMATVYLARDVKHKRRVALKVLKPDLGAVVGVERFLSEIQVTANLQHPNLLPLFDSGAVGSLLFYVMPYVDGESLRARLQREKQLPVDEGVCKWQIRAGPDISQAWLPFVVSRWWGRSTSGGPCTPRDIRSTKTTCCRRRTCCS